MIQENVCYLINTKFVKVAPILEVKNQYFLILSSSKLYQT